MGCFDSPSADPDDQVLQNELADISREQFDDYTTRYEPLLDELAGMATDESFVTEAVDRSKESVAGNFAQARSDIDTTNSRYRVGMTDRQTEAQENVLQMGETSSMVDVQNRARDGAADLQDALRLSVIGTGQGVREEALGNLASGANLESQRMQNNLAAQGQYQSGMWGLGSSALGTAGTLMMLSDRTKKKDIDKADTGKHLNEVVNLNLYDYRYKGEIDPSKKLRVGTMWQEAESLRAPEGYGKVLDLGDWNAKNTGAIQELHKQLSQMRQEVLSLRKSA